MSAYYNEIDRFAAAWLRNLIAAGHLPPGDVDERSIVDVRPSDLDGYTQCHFFAGIGGWPYALSLAGWSDRPVWTGSCPCQPFSSAGKQGGSTDERHLWPQWLRLIRECRPDAVFGEQVEGAVGFGWIDRVFADLEAEGYACGAAVLGAHSVGAPHIRQRLFWVADSRGAAAGAAQAASRAAGWGPAEPGLGSAAGGVADAVLGGSGARRGDAGEERGLPQAQRQPEHGAAVLGGNGAARWVADADEAGSDRQRRAGLSGNADAPQRHDADGCGEASWLGHADSERSQGRANGSVAAQGWDTPGRQAGLPSGGLGNAAGEQVGRARQPWQDSVWLPCLDGRARRVEPAIQPLASGIPNRVGLLRGSGNAIVPQVAAQFIGAFLDAT